MDGDPERDVPAAAALAAAGAALAMCCSFLWRGALMSLRAEAFVQVCQKGECYGKKVFFGMKNTKNETAFTFFRLFSFRFRFRFFFHFNQKTLLCEE